MGSVHKTGLLPDDAAVLERAGHLLAIGRALDRLYPDQPAAVAWWMRAPYQDFAGLSALTLMRTGVEGIKRVRTHIESWLKTPATE